MKRRLSDHLIITCRLFNYKGRTNLLIEGHALWIGSTNYHDGITIF